MRPTFEHQDVRIEYALFLANSKFEFTDIAPVYAIRTTEESQYVIDILSNEGRFLRVVTFSTLAVALDCACKVNAHVHIAQNVPLITPAVIPASHRINHFTLGFVVFVAVIAAILASYEIIALFNLLN